MDALQTLNAFWNSFGLPAYDENSVPEYVDDGSGRLAKLEPPYITYEAPLDDFGRPLAQTASLWYRSSGWTDITAKEQQIADYITKGGRMIAYDGGCIWIQRGSPWAQRLSEASDKTIRRINLNVIVEYLD